MVVATRDVVTMTYATKVNSNGRARPEQPDANEWFVGWLLGDANAGYTAPRGQVPAVVEYRAAEVVGAKERLTGSLDGGSGLIEETDANDWFVDWLLRAATS